MRVVDLPRSADVVVVGSGITGAATVQSPVPGATGQFLGGWGAGTRLDRRRSVIVGAGVWTAHLAASSSAPASAPGSLRELRYHSSLGTALVPDTSPEPFCDRRSADLAVLRLAQVASPEVMI